MALRSYHRDGCHHVAQRRTGSPPKALLVMPTGSGKTVVFSEICRLADNKNQGTCRLQSLFTAVNSLFRQASRKLAVEHGIIAAGLKPSAQHPVQVASVQTLARRLRTVPVDPDLIIIDEAHHAVAGSWDKIIAHFTDAKIIGVTATPSRLDGRGLGSHFSRPRLRAIRRKSSQSLDSCHHTGFSRRPLSPI